ncbi:hypothetical protein Y1Q_0007274 [Alligator mississippiensis]|uniref:Uncharacterized protein n=1 Tax=Alligator mississippiensis TaxID=8496 RepID=A0A151NMV4_ALLMI|nr:hypothetical protein Y1Q_0007274 [Alligator mississippiensis]
MFKLQERAIPPHKKASSTTILFTEHLASVLYKTLATVMARNAVKKQKVPTLANSTSLPLELILPVNLHLRASVL